MARGSDELSKLSVPIPDKKPTELTEIYKSSTLLLNVYLLLKRKY